VGHAVIIWDVEHLLYHGILGGLSDHRAAMERRGRACAYPASTSSVRVCLGLYNLAVCTLHSPFGGTSHIQTPLLCWRCARIVVARDMAFKAKLNRRGKRRGNGVNMTRYHRQLAWCWRAARDSALCILSVFGLKTVPHARTPRTAL